MSGFNFGPSQYYYSTRQRKHVQEHFFFFFLLYLTIVPTKKKLDNLPDSSYLFFLLTFLFLPIARNVGDDCMSFCV